MRISDWSSDVCSSDLLTASLAGGQLLFLPAFAALSQAWGWRLALSLLLAMILICALAILALMRDRPADIGLLPYGASEVTCEPEDPGSFAAMLVSPLLVLSGVSRSLKIGRAHV